VKKAILIIFGSIILLYSVFILEESIRLSHNEGSKPLIVLDKVFCSKEDYGCYDMNGEYEEKYISLGFVFKQGYYLDEGSTSDNYNYHLYKEEFYLFNKIFLWGWIN